MQRPDKANTSYNDTGRLETFSDAVFGIIITITVLGVRPPAGTALNDLKPLIPKLLVYALSFTVLGIYWNNHHHLLRATKRISSGIMWANLYLLFWLSLIPIVAEWVGVHPRSSWPVASFGIVGLMAAFAYSPVLTSAIIRANREHPVARALRRDLKGIASIVLYAAAIGIAFVNPLLSLAVYVPVSIIWFIPDRRLEEPVLERSKNR
jgi:uncharacterized membrane protein